MLLLLSLLFISLTFMFCLARFLFLFANWRLSETWPGAGLDQLKAVERVTDIGGNVIATPPLPLLLPNSRATIFHWTPANRTMIRIQKRCIRLRSYCCKLMALKLGTRIGVGGPYRHGSEWVVHIVTFSTFSLPLAVTGRNNLVRTKHIYFKRVNDPKRRVFVFDRTVCYDER